MSHIAPIMSSWIWPRNIGGWRSGCLMICTSNCISVVVVTTWNSCYSLIFCVFSLRGYVILRQSCFCYFPPSLLQDWLHRVFCRWTTNWCLCANSSWVVRELSGNFSARFWEFPCDLAVQHLSSLPANWLIVMCIVQCTNGWIFINVLGCFWMVILTELVWRIQQGTRTQDRAALQGREVQERQQQGVLRSQMFGQPQNCWDQLSPALFGWCLLPLPERPKGQAPFSQVWKWNTYLMHKKGKSKMLCFCIFCLVQIHHSAALDTECGWLLAFACNRSQPALSGWVTNWQPETDLECIEANGANIKLITRNWPNIT